MSEPQALNRLADLLAECSMEMAEMVKAAEEHRDYVVETVSNQRRALGTVSRMAGLGDLPEMRIERQVKRAS
jgi:hypothetical protein